MVDDITKQQKSEEALQKAYSDMYQIFNTAGDAMRVVDTNFDVIHANKAYAQLIDSPVDELIGMKCYQAYTCSTKQGSEECCLQQILNGKEQITSEHEYQINGVTKYCIVNTVAYRDEKGVLIGIIQNIKDVTERRKAQDRLREKEIEYNYLYNHLNDAVLIKDFNGNILHANDEAQRRLGYSLEELSQMNAAQITSSELTAGFGDTFKKLILQPGSFRHETVHMAKDGTLIPTEISGRVITFRGEKAVLSIAIDITERKRVEQEIVRAKREWEKTFDAMTDIVTVMDKDFHIIRANKATYSFFNVGPEELIGKHCYELFRGDSTPCLECPLLETLDDSTNHCTENILHKNLGKIFHVSSAPVFDNEGELQFLVHIARDVTDVKQMEEELFQAHKMEAIGTLAGGIAHDFNNILAAILGYADMAKDDIPESSRSYKDIDQAIKAGHRAKDLVRQILTFSRKGSETQQPLQPVSIIKEVLKLLRATLPTTIEIRQEIDVNCGWIVANPTNIHQVLVNLCTNAFQAMEDEKGVLTVRLQSVELENADVISEPGISEGKFVELMVSDTGCGMEKATIERIFDPYFTTKGVGKGSGIGLAMVHGIVHSYAGFIKVESEPGKGATFRVYFPTLPEKVEKRDEQQQELLPRGEERILAVDDEEVIVAMCQTILESLGYTVAACCSSEKAFELFQSSPESFDLIITDQTMPKLSGAELAQKVLQIRPEIPIILCTGYSSMISEKQSKEIGINRFVMKPINRRELAITVREVLDNKQLDAL